MNGERGGAAEEASRDCEPERIEATRRADGRRGAESLGSGRIGRMGNWAEDYSSWAGHYVGKIGGESLLFFKMVW
jgi:hypothetical protein